MRCRTAILISCLIAIVIIQVHLALSGCGKRETQLDISLPGWLPGDASIVEVPRSELQRVALITVPAGKTVVLPVRIIRGEKYMLSWKLVSGPKTIGYMVRDPNGTIEFGLGGLTAVSKGRYDAELRYFCFINDTTPAVDARVAVATLFYEDLPVMGDVAVLPIQGRVELKAAPPPEKANVMPILVSQYSATVFDNLYFSPVFSLSEGEVFAVKLSSDAPIGIRLPPRTSEHKIGPDVDISQATRYSKERAEWSYYWGKVEVKQYTRLDGGRRVELVLVAKPDNKDAEYPGLYQLRVTNGDEARPHWLEYSIVKG